MAFLTIFGTVLVCTAEHSRARFSWKSERCEVSLCPRVTARAQADVPVLYPRLVVCLYNMQ